MVRLKTIPWAIAVLIACSCLGEVARAQNYNEIEQRNVSQLTQQSNQRNNYLGKILLMAGLVSGVGLIGWQLSQSRRFASSNNPLRQARQKDKLLLERVSPRLRRKLLRLINDPKTANRLLTGIEQHHPHRSPDWIAEKVIYDFQRGR